MLNCQQVKSIYAVTQEELQDLVNEELKKLGKRVQKIDFISPLCEGYGVNIVYWSQDIASTMTCKLEELPDEPEAEDGAKLFVSVLHDFHRSTIEKLIEEKIYALTQNCKDEKYNAREQDLFSINIPFYERLLSRFKDDEEQLE